jgi:hypothetical protein
MVDKPTTLESIVGSTVLVSLSPEAYQALDLQGVDTHKFYAKVVGFDQIGLWVKNPSYISVPTHNLDGTLIPVEERKAETHVAHILIQWSAILTIAYFPGRVGFAPSERVSSIGFHPTLEVK